jgi:hypothetical protein
MAALGARPAAHDPITTKITFAREVRAILSARCVTCHGPGGSAPMPLTTYDEVRPWARAIKEQVLTRRMPKWHAARGFGSFGNDPTLTPIEIAMIVAWIDGGLPYSTASPRVPAASAASTGSTAAASPGSTAATPARPALVASASKRRIGIPAVTVRAGAADATGRVRAGWISGWSFEPGDPLITSATFTLADGTPAGSWVAGDGPVTLPPGTALRLTSRLKVTLQRREAADFEQPYKSRPSVLRLVTRTKPPARRASIARQACASQGAAAGAQLLAVRPLLPAGQSARIAVQRTGAPATILGWFRDVDPAFARWYWLGRPTEFGVDARLSSDAPCEVELLLTSK